MSSRYPILRLAVVLILLLTFAVSCSDSVSNRSVSDALVAAVSDQTLQIHNRSDTPVFYFAHSEGALIQWHPVSGSDNIVVPDRTVSIPLEEVAAYTKGRDIVIHYWTDLDPAIDSIRQLRVRIK